MTSWGEHLTDVIQAIAGCGSRERACEIASERLDRPVTWDSIEQAYNRARHRGEVEGTAYQVVTEDDFDIDWDEQTSPERCAFDIPESGTVIPTAPGRVKHCYWGDGQIRKGVPIHHWLWIARFTAEKDVDVVIQGGDWYDMPSFSDWDSTAKKAARQQTIADDFDSGNRAWELVFGEWERLGWRPKRMVFCLGNHEQRIERFVANNPHHRGDYNYGRFLTSQIDWVETYGFLTEVPIDGVTYSHFFPRGANGKVMQTKRGAPNARAQILRNMKSCTAGHAQGLDTAIHYTGDRAYRGTILGSTYLHDEEYIEGGATSNHYWRGILLKHGVKNGWYDLCEVPLDFLEEKYR